MGKQKENQTYGSKYDISNHFIVLPLIGTIAERHVEELVTLHDLVHVLEDTLHAFLVDDSILEYRLFIFLKKWVNFRLISDRFVKMQTQAF